MPSFVITYLSKKKRGMPAIGINNRTRPVIANINRLAQEVFEIKNKTANGMIIRMRAKNFASFDFCFLYSMKNFVAL